MKHLILALNFISKAVDKGFFAGFFTNFFTDSPNSPIGHLDKKMLYKNLRVTIITLTFIFVVYNSYKNGYLTEAQLEQLYEWIF